MTSKKKKQRKKLWIGKIQVLKGEEIAERIAQFLAPFDAATKTRLDTDITRLHGITSPARFKKQTLALLATLYDNGYAKGLAKGRGTDET